MIEAKDQLDTRDGLDYLRAMIRDAYSCELGAGVYKTSALNDMMSITPKDHPKPMKATFNKLSNTEFDRLTEKQQKQYIDALDSFRYRQNNPISVKESRRPGRSIPLEYRGGYQWLLKRINTAPTQYKLIIWHLYKPDSGVKHFNDLIDLLGPDVETLVSGRWGKTKNMARRMLAAHLRLRKNELEYYFLTYNPRKYFNIPPKQWEKTDLGVWRLVTGYFEGLDEKALNHVCT